MRNPQLRRDLLVESKLRKVQKKSISEDITEQIMDLIASGDLAPGQRLPTERDLCINFGASRSSLREALRCLSIVGVLDAGVREGTSVAVNGDKFLGKVMEWRLITEKHEIVGLMDVRKALEGLSASSAATRATDGDIQTLEQILARTKKAANDPKMFSALDLEFHIELANVSGNAVLRDLVSMIRSQLARVLTRVLLLPNALPLSYEEHSKIVQAIKRRDPQAAKEAMENHLQLAVERYRAYNDSPTLAMGVDVRMPRSPKTIRTEKKNSSNKNQSPIASTNGRAPSSRNVKAARA